MGTRQVFDDSRKETIMYEEYRAHLISMVLENQMRSFFREEDLEKKSITMLKALSEKGREIQSAESYRNFLVTEILKVYIGTPSEVETLRNKSISALESIFEKIAPTY